MSGAHESIPEDVIGLLILDSEVITPGIACNPVSRELIILLSPVLLFSVLIIVTMKTRDVPSDQSSTIARITLASLYTREYPSKTVMYCDPHVR